MPADANIFQSYLQAPKSVMDYTAMYDQADARKNALQQSVQALQKSQMDMANAADVNRQRNALRDAVTSGQIDLSNPDHTARALSLAPDVAPALLKTVQDGLQSRAKASLDTAQAGKATADTGKITAETQAAAVSHMGDAIAALQQLPGVSPAHVVASIQNAGKLYGIPDALVQQAVAQVPQDPAQLPAFLQAKNAQLMSAKERMAYVAPDANTVANNTTSRANNAATNATSRANNSANIGKDYRVAGLNTDGTDPSGTVGGLTQDAIDNAAKRYNFDGSLPPSLGRGTQGARDIRGILTRAAELAGSNPADTSGGRAGQMANKADSTALTQLTKQQQVASSFESTANANADIALGLSKKLDRTGIPLVNAGLQAWRTGTGSPEATQFAAANETFVNEYAKIMSGGMGNGPVTDSARNKAHTLLTTSMTPEQYEGNVRLLQREMQNRMKGYSDQIDSINTRLKGGTAPAHGATPAAAAPAGWKYIGTVN